MTESRLSAAFAELTDAQRAAVAWQDGALLVLAGPGSGKTRVLTTRIARILEESQDRAYRVLALTFTNRAADEMVSRVMLLVPGQERRAVIGTYHSFCMQMLQQHGTHLGIRTDFAIYSLDDDRRELMSEAIRRSSDLHPSDTRYLSVIDKLKARLIEPEGCARHFRDQLEGARAERVYQAYEEELARANALDFGSLIAQAYKLVTSFPGVAGLYRRTYAYWLIDEFQDTTDGQYRLIRTLAGDSFKNVFTVADDDQIIYQWNGASFRQLERFRADFAPDVVQLPTNYRCPPAIVIAANRLVVHNVQRTSTKRPLEAGKTELRYSADRHLRVRRFATEVAEAKATVANVLSLGPENWSLVVVLARTRNLLESAQKAFEAAGVPAVIAQRRDDFRSPSFLWLSTVLQQAARPLDRRNFETLTGAFNRWFSLEMRADLVVAEAEASSRSFLEEWALAVPRSNGAISELADLAGALAHEPSAFRGFVDRALALFPQGDETSSDISEDQAAWRDLVRSIGQSVGRDAPLELFLQELGLRSKEPPRGPGMVALMTIHGAKGKEFDHVYLIGVAEDVLPSFQSIKAGLTSAEMEEERRNCFVAITRARECLCLSWADQYRGWSRAPSRFLTEMGIDLPEHHE